MLGWSDIAPKLIDVFTETSIDTARRKERYRAEWDTSGAGGKAINDEQKLAVRLKVTTVVGFGEDETRWIENEDGTQSGLQTGQRKFNLQVQAISQDRTDEAWAMLALERIRTRLHRPRVIEELLDLDVSVIRVGQSLKATFKDRGREMSAAVMDVTMGCVVNDLDDVPTGVIEHVRITSELQDIDGIEMPSPPNFVDSLVSAPSDDVAPGPYVQVDGSGFVQVDDDDFIIIGA